MAGKKKNSAIRNTDSDNSSLFNRLSESRGLWKWSVYISLLLNIILCLLLFDPKPHTGGDNASYIFLAESILDISSPYADNISPGEVKPHTQYPFGYPLTLAPVVAFFGRNVVALKVVSLLMISLCVILSSLLFKDKMSLLFASLFTFAIAVNPTFVEYGHWILSEATFAASAILSLFLMEKFEENPGDRKRSKFFILAILAMVYTAHIKTVGLVLVIAGVFYLTVKRRWKHLSIFVLLTVMLVSPWMIRNRINYDPKAIGYDKQLLMKNPYSPELGDIGVSDFIVRIGKNIKSYSTREIGRAFCGYGNAARRQHDA